MVRRPAPRRICQPANVAILLTAGENIWWKLDKLSAIATEVLADPQAKTTLQRWIKTSLVLVGRRYDLIHSFYMARDGDRPLTRMKATTRGGRWKARSEPIDLDSLTETAGLLAEGLEVADLIVQQLAADCPDWHDAAAPTAS